MNKKLIAAAVSAAVVPAVGVADTSFYGRINHAYDVNGLGAESTTDATTIGSRIGWRANNDIGNGLTAHAHLEFGVTTDKEGEANNGTKVSGIDTRVGTAGLSGQFGRIDVGNQTSAYSATFGTLVSPTYSLGYYLYTLGGGIFRSSNAVKYTNSFGALSAQLEMRFNGSEEGTDVAETTNGDGFGLGLSFALSDNLTLAAAIDTENADEDSTDDDESRTGVAIKANFGGFSATVGIQMYDSGKADAPSVLGSGMGALDDTAAVSATNPGTVGSNGEVSSTFLNLAGSVSDKTGWLIAYSTADDGVEAVTSTANEVGPVNAFDDSTQLTWGVYHNMGSGMRLYYEGTSLSSPRTGNDGSRHLLGMRVDF